MITCGHCNGQHQTVAEVRNCAPVRTTAEQFEALVTAPTLTDVLVPDAPTDAQLRYLTTLATERGLPVPEVASKAQASAAIDRLLKQPRTTQPTARPASDKQVAFLRRLVTEHSWAGVIDNVDVDTDRPEWIEKITGPQASKIIDALTSAPRRQATQAPSVKIESGAYRVDDRIIRVYFGRQSGQQLASELVDRTATSRDDAWRYLGRADRVVPADAHRLTVEEAEAINDNDADHGWCCVCGAYLDDPNSVRRGIGPVCRQNQGA